MKHAARGAAPVSGSSPRPRLEQLPYWIACGGVGLGLLTIGSGAQNVRSGTLEIAGVLLAAAAARLVLPARLAGMLAARRRLADAAVLGALGIGLLASGLVFPAP